MTTVATSSGKPCAALSGVRVVDLTRTLPGPYCTMLLASLGADVIKVEEPPFGDLTRAVPPAWDGESVTFAVLNRGKRSIGVDLRRDGGVEIVTRLALQADVLIEGFRPGALTRHGLGAAQLRARHPRLIYCSLSGYGAHGPLAARAGHDLDYVARAGLLAEQPDAQGEPRVPAFQAADMAGGLYAALGVLAALQARERSGAGQQVDVSLFGAALGLMTVPLARAAAATTPPDELTGVHACYGVFRCRDGRHVAVGALEPKFWEALVDQLGLPELRGRQWLTGAQRDDARRRVAAVFATRDRAEWLAALADCDVCVEPVFDAAETLAQPQAAAYLVEDRVAGRALRAVGVPVALHGTPVRCGQAPAPGQHTDELLAELGYAPSDVLRLRDEGVVQ